MCFGFLVLKTIWPPPIPTLPVMLNIWDNSVQSEILNFLLARPGNDSESDNTRQINLLGLHSQNNWIRYSANFLKTLFFSAVQAFEALCFELKICLFIPLPDIICLCPLLCFCLCILLCLCLSPLKLELKTLVIVWPLPHIVGSVEKDYLGEKKKSHERMSVAPHYRRVYLN